MVNVILPGVYEYIFDSVDIFNFDLTWVLSAGCIIDTDLHDKILIATLGPLVVMAILGGTYIVAMHRSCSSTDTRNVVYNKHVYIVLLPTFLSDLLNGFVDLVQDIRRDNIGDGKIYLQENYRI